MSGPLRTTLDIHRLLVQQIYVRTADNKPISTGHVLVADGSGGTFFSPVVQFRDFANLSSLITTANTDYRTQISSSLSSQIGVTRFHNLALSNQTISTFNTVGIFVSNVATQVETLSNLILNISDFSAYTNFLNARFSTLSSFVLNLGNIYTTINTTERNCNILLERFTTRQTELIDLFTGLETSSSNDFQNNINLQEVSFVNNRSTLSTQFNVLLDTSSRNYSTLSTNIGNQQNDFNIALSSQMSSFKLNLSSVLVNNLNQLSTTQGKLTSDVASLSSLFISVATDSLSTQVAFINSSSSNALGTNVSSLSTRLSTLQSTTNILLSSLSRSAVLTNDVTNLSTSLQSIYSTLARELLITQTRGINSQLFRQFELLGFTQSTILATNTSSINYLSTVIAANSESTQSTFTRLTVANFSTLRSLGFSSIRSAVREFEFSTASLVASTNTSFSTEILIQLTRVGNQVSSQSTFLGRTLSTSDAFNLSTLTSSVFHISRLISANTTLINQNVSSFSSAVFPHINLTFASLSTLNSNLANTVSNFTINTVSNTLRGSIGTLQSNLANTTSNSTDFPQITNTCNALLGIISTTFSSLSSTARFFAKTNTSNTFSGDITFLSPLEANGGIYSRFFDICNVISTYIFQNTGLIQNYTPNPFANQVLVQLWGGGGARGTNTNGGGSAYVEGIIDVDTSRTYNIAVGSGGTFNSNISPFGGGGKGKEGRSGAGGGATSIYSGANILNLESYLAIAGGGGGGGIISSFANWTDSDILNKNIITFSIGTTVFNNFPGGVLNSTIFLPIGSWGGNAGVAFGSPGISPISSFSTGAFSLSGRGGAQTQNLNFNYEKIVRTSEFQENVSSMTLQSTFITHLTSFIPSLMGFDQFAIPAISTALSTFYINDSNYTEIIDNIDTYDNIYEAYSNFNYHSAFNENYGIFFINSNQPSNSDISQHIRKNTTLYDIYSGEFGGNALVASRLPKTDATTTKTPTIIFSANLTCVIRGAGQQYGLAVDFMTFPFAPIDNLHWPYVKTYADELVTEISGVDTYTDFGLEEPQYNGEYRIPGLLGSKLNINSYDNLNNLKPYDYLLRFEKGVDYTSYSISSSTFTFSNIKVRDFIKDIYFAIFTQGHINAIGGGIPKVIMPNSNDFIFNCNINPLANNIVETNVETELFNESSVLNAVNSNFLRPLSTLSHLFISTIGRGSTENGASEIISRSLPLFISSGRIEPADEFPEKVLSLTYLNMQGYIRNIFREIDSLESAFTINDVSLTYKIIGEFPTINYSEKKFSTINFLSTFIGTKTNTVNEIFQGSSGSIFQGGNATDAAGANIDGINGMWGGGGGGGYFGGGSGAFSRVNAPYIIGAGGGGGGSSYINPLTGTGKSVSGKLTSTGFIEHPLARQLGIGRGGVDVNANLNWISTATYTLATTTNAIGNGGNGLVILTEFVDPFKITISTASNFFVPLRINSQTNEVVVNKLVISSAQHVTFATNSPSTAFLDFGNYQHFHISLNNYNNTWPIHIIPMSTISSPTMNYQSGNIALVINTANTVEKKIILSSFIIDKSWLGEKGVIIPSSLGVHMFDYTIFNSNAYLSAQYSF